VRILGIAGGSGAGKTALAGAVAQRLARDRVLLLPQDDYYHDLSALSPAERAVRNFDEPPAVDLDLLAAHLLTLRAGRPVEVPCYDMRTHTRAGRRTEAPKPFAIVDGTMIATHRGLREALDLLVFLDLPEEARFARRLARDVADRARTPEEVRRKWSAQTIPMHHRYVEPAREFADLVLSGAEPLEANARGVVRRLRPGVLGRVVGALRERRRNRRLRAAARHELRGLFDRPDRLRGTSLRPEHAARAVLLDFEAEAGRITALAFGILRHPRPHAFSRQFHEVLEYWRADLAGDGPVERVKGVNLSRAKGRDGEPGGFGPGV
jgi:uridine kinase